MQNDVLMWDCGVFQPIKKRFVARSKYHLGEEHMARIMNSPSARDGGLGKKSGRHGLTTS